MADVMYFDSALIAKFYLNEPRREVVRQLTRDSGRVVSSAIAMAEVSAAFHRKLREGNLSQAGFKSVHGQFHHDVNAGLWLLRPVSEALLETVAEFLARLPASVYLRALDALHLMTAKSENFDRLYTNDRHLLAACPAVGLRGINPLG